MDLANAVRQLKPDVAWKSVRLEGGWMNVEDGGPLAGIPGCRPRPRALPMTRAARGGRSFGKGAGIPEHTPKITRRQESWFPLEIRLKAGG